MKNIKHPSVAGIFYPKNKIELTTMIENFLNEAKKHEDNPIPKAIIAPHAGYIYSGSIAASAYAVLKKARGKIDRVIVIAPAHRYPFYGVAASSATFFATPLGEIEADENSLKKISSINQVATIDSAFTDEHALEVQLPFLQKQLEKFTLVPLLAGIVNEEEIATILDVLWGGEETLIVISSDLSHYNDYQKAKKIDEKTAKNIIAFDYQKIESIHACGCIPICGLLKIAQKKGLCSKLIDLRNSGDIIGNKEELVVGYGAFHFYNSKL